MNPVRGDEVRSDGMAAELYLADSGIHGQGVFAGELIPKGTQVIRCQGILKPGSAIREGERAMQIGPDTYLAEDPANPGLDDIINHSCDPNLAFQNGTLVLHALRDIARDEELFWDYSTTMNEPGWEVECTCGAPNCRGKIQSYCDLPSPVKERLRDMVLAWLR